MRSFLIRQPNPATIRLTVREGETKDIVPKRRQSWSKIAETIVAFAPELVECLDEQANIIRAVRPQSTPELSDAPDPPKIISEDPETARLTHFANLLHRAYEHSTIVAFSKLIELVERLDARAEAVEARLERAETAYRRQVQSQLDDAFNRADELLAEGEQQQGSELHQMASAFLQAASGAKPKRPTNGSGDA